MHLVLTPQTLPDAVSYNVIADLKGSESPEQIVVVSLTWIPGTLVRERLTTRPGSRSPCRRRRTVQTAWPNAATHATRGGLDERGERPLGEQALCGRIRSFAAKSRWGNRKRSRSRTPARIHRHIQSIRQDLASANHKRACADRSNIVDAGGAAADVDAIGTA